MKKLLSTKRFWGIIISAVGSVMKGMDIPFAEHIIAVGGSVAAAGFIDATKSK